MSNRPVFSIAAATVLAISFLMFAPQISAQEFGAAFAGFGSDNKEPIQIQSDSLEVRDSESRAIFSGNVDVIQGDTHLKTAVLDVYYTGQAGNTAGGQGIDRLIATGKVWVKTGTNEATGEKAVYSATDNTVVLSGDVVLTQCGNVIRGSSLRVDLATGQANLKANKTSGRVQGLFIPGKGGAQPSATPKEGC